MRRKVLGFDKVIEELKKGNCICTIAYADNDWMVVDSQICTVRNDFINKAYRNGYTFKEKYREGSLVREITLA